MPEPADVMPTFLPASSFASLIGEFGLHHQVPAVIAERGARDVLRHHALLDAGRDRGRRVEDHVGGARRHRLVAFRAAAIDRQLRLDAFLVEQLLAQRGLGDDGRVIGLGRQPDAHDLALRARDRRHAERRGAGRAVAEHAAARRTMNDRHEFLPAERFCFILRSRSSPRLSTLIRAHWRRAQKSFSRCALRVDSGVFGSTSSRATQPSSPGRAAG